MFLAINILAFVLGTIWPLFNACSMLFVLIPFSNIGSSVGVLVGSMSVSFVIQPLSFIDVAICMD